jgi:hypothetical protein
LESTWEASLSPAFQLVANGDPLPMLDLGQLGPQRFDAGLKVAASATKEEIVYRRKIQQCHPDRVAGLAPEFLELAEERSKALNAAYAQAIRKVACTKCQWKAAFSRTELLALYGAEYPLPTGHSNVNSG